MTASFYGSILLSKKISFYFKQDFVNIDYGWSYSGPEVFGIAKLFPHNGYIKAGIFMPDYGWRLDDHTTYTRGGDISIGNGWFAANGLFFNPNYKDIGVESGFNIDDFTITASILNGTGNQSHYYLSTDKAYTGKIEYLGKVSDLNYRLGVSGYGFKSYKMGAITAGFAYDDWILYGEVDFTHHKLLDPTNAIHPIDEHANMSAAFAELDFQAIQGLWLTGKYDMSDPFNGIADNDLTPTTNAVQRLIFGLEFFPYSFVELRPQYRHFIEKPSADNDQALIQLHMWF